MDKSFINYLMILPFIVVFISCESRVPYDQSEDGFKQFIVNYETQIEPIMIKSNQAVWDAYTTGKKEYFAASTELSLQIDALYQNTSHFQYLKDLKEKKAITEPVLQRQLDILYSEYLQRQIDPELNKKITELASNIESIFGNFRTTLDGKTYTDNQVTQILKSEKNSEYREHLWRAQKALGNVTGEKIRKLAKLRNQAAEELGYENYFYMAMDMKELDPHMVESVFFELNKLTEQPYKKLHDEIENVFSVRYSIEKSEICPWHYEDLFSQQAPAIFEIDLDRYYADIDIPKTASTFYASTQIPVDDILKRSDLYEREGKNQHAYSFCIDRKQDIRILCNIVSNERWMETMLHELGHAIYDKYIDQSLPFLLREPAHPFTTEGVAMFFGSYASNAGWVKNALNVSKKELKKIEQVTKANLRLSKLIFARWSMVVFNFEMNFYKNPDQDLNKLWWDLVEKYQLITRPDNPVGSEWATKIHIATYPVYYQNYQLGELFASQILNYIAENYDDDAPIDQVIFWYNTDAGNYLKDKIFKPGKKLAWNDMIKNATGEFISAKYFVKQYVTSN